LQELKAIIIENTNIADALSQILALAKTELDETNDSSPNK
jgi:hypothetical protein